MSSVSELITTLVFSFYYFYPFGSKVHPISFIQDHISKFEVMIKTNYLRPILIFKPNLVNKDLLNKLGRISCKFPPTQFVSSECHSVIGAEQ